MRIIRMMQAAFLVILLLLDLVVGSVISTFSLGPIVFVSSMHVLGLIILAQNDNLIEMMAKVILVTVWLDLNHIASYPVFLFSYVITFLLFYKWRKYVGSTGLEFMVMAILVLFVKEFMMYLALVVFKSYEGSLVGFIAYRSFWVVLGNMIFVPFVLWLHKQMHRMILQRAQNVYMR